MRLHIHYACRLATPAPAPLASIRPPPPRLRKIISAGGGDKKKWPNRTSCVSAGAQGAYTQYLLSIAAVGQWQKEWLKKGAQKRPLQMGIKLAINCRSGPRQRIDIYFRIYIHSRAYRGALPRALSARLSARVLFDLVFRSSIWPYWSVSCEKLIRACICGQEDSEGPAIRSMGFGSTHAFVGGGIHTVS